MPSNNDRITRTVEQPDEIRDLEARTDDASKVGGGDTATTSTILKTVHDTSKNTISNLP